MTCEKGTVCGDKVFTHVVQLFDDFDKFDQLSVIFTGETKREFDMNCVRGGRLPFLAYYERDD